MDPQNMNSEDKYKDICPCNGTKNKGCSCIERCIENKISSESNEFQKREEVLDELLGIRSTATILSKESPSDEDFPQSNTGQGGVPTRRSRSQKTRRYKNYILEKRQELKAYGMCEVSCKNILGYSNNLMKSLLQNDPENRNAVTTQAKSFTRRRRPKPSIEQLSVIKCCNRYCNQLLTDNTQYWNELRENAKISNKNKRKAITTLVNYSNTSRPTCNKFIYQVLSISRTTLRTVKNKLTDKAKSDQIATNNAQQPTPQRGPQPPHHYILSQNQPEFLQTMPGTINNSHFQPNNMFTDNMVNNIQLPTQEFYQYIYENFNINTNLNQTVGNFSHQYSNHQPIANHSIHATHINGNQCMGQLISDHQFVDRSWNQMHYRNNLQQQVQIPYHQYPFQTIQQYMHPVNAPYQYHYQNIPVNDTNINGQQTEAAYQNIGNGQFLVINGDPQNMVPIYAPSQYQYQNTPVNDTNFNENQTEVHYQNNNNYQFLVRNGDPRNMVPVNALSQYHYQNMPVNATNINGQKTEVHYQENNNRQFLVINGDQQNMVPVNAPSQYHYQNMPVNITNFNEQQTEVPYDDNDNRQFLVINGDQQNMVPVIAPSQYHYNNMPQNDTNINGPQTEVHYQDNDTPQLPVTNGEYLQSMPMASGGNINQNISPNAKYQVDTRETDKNSLTYNTDSISANDHARLVELLKSIHHNRSQ